MITWTGYRRTETDRWDSDDCEHNINECKNDPCLNDGKCVDGENEFTCECPTGFDGDTCDVGKCMVYLF